MYLIATLLALILMALLWPQQTRKGLSGLWAVALRLLWIAWGLLQVVAIAVASVWTVRLTARYWPVSGYLIACIVVAVASAIILQAAARDLDRLLDRAYARRHPWFGVVWRAMDRSVARMEARGANLTGPIDELQAVAWASPPGRTITRVPFFVLGPIAPRSLVESPPWSSEDFRKSVKASCCCWVLGSTERSWIFRRRHADPGHRTRLGPIRPVPTAARVGWVGGLGKGGGTMKSKWVP
jgi:hypothetical protein